MEHDPLSAVEDAPLFIVPRVLDGLRAYRAQSRSALLAALADTLLAGIEAHPTKFWVMRQFQKTLAAVADDDAQARDHVCTALETLMDILGIDNSNGVLGPRHR